MSDRKELPEDHWSWSLIYLAVPVGAVAAIFVFVRHLMAGGILDFGLVVAMWVVGGIPIVIALLAVSLVELVRNSAARKSKVGGTHE